MEAGRPGLVEKKMQDASTLARLFSVEQHDAVFGAGAILGRSAAEVISTRKKADPHVRPNQP
jgi:hypothetical protein